MIKGKTTDFVQGNPFEYPTFGSRKKQQMYFCETCKKDKQRRYFYGSEEKIECNHCKARVPGGHASKKRTN